LLHEIVNNACLCQKHAGASLREGRRRRLRPAGDAGV
jgi:hypothetical protein